MLVSCGRGGNADDGSSVTTPSGRATTLPATRPVPNVTTPAATTPETARPPATDENGDTLEPQFTTTSEVVISLSPTTLSIGDELTITIECPRRDTKATAFITPTNLNSSHSNEGIIDVPPANPAETLFETVVVVPYWLSPGPHPVDGGCGRFGAANPPILNVIQSESGTAELWEPLRHPWVEHDRPAGAVPPPPIEHDRAYGRWGEALEVHAACPPDIPIGQARFILWRDAVLEPPFFYAVEYPVPPDGYDSTENGVVVSAEIVVDRDEFTERNPYDMKNYKGSIAVVAMCIATPTPFLPIVEPRLPRLALSLE